MIMRVVRPEEQARMKKTGCWPALLWAFQRADRQKKDNLGFVKAATKGESLNHLLMSPLRAWEKQPC